MSAAGGARPAIPQRTAKPCGPGIPALVPVCQTMILPATETTKPPAVLLITSEIERECDSADQDQADSPAGIQVEPAPRDKSQIQIAVDEPGQASTGTDHCDDMDNGDENRDAEISFDRRANRSMVNIGTAEAEIDRHEHQTGSVRNRDRERPEPESGRRYPCQRSGMASIEQAKHTEADDDEGRSELHRAPPLGKREQKSERQQHHEDCKQ